MILGFEQGGGIEVFLDWDEGARLCFFYSFFEGSEGFWLFGERFSGDLSEDANSEGSVIFWFDFSEDEAGGLSLYFFQIFGESEAICIVGAGDIISIRFSWKDGFVISPDPTFVGDFYHFEGEGLRKEEEFVVIA